MKTKHDSKVLIIFLLLFFALFVSIPLGEGVVSATIDLDVNAYAPTQNDWSSGGSAPWLDDDDDDGNYVYTSGNLDIIEHFGFITLPSWVTEVSAVRLHMKFRTEISGDGGGVQPWLWNGTDWVGTGTWRVVGTTYYEGTPFNYDAILTTADMVNSAILKFNTDSTMASTIHVTYAYLRVTYGTYFDGVSLRITAKVLSGSSVDLNYSLWDGSAWSSGGNLTYNSTSYATQVVDVTSVLGTTAKIDDARLRLNSSDYMAVTHAFLYLVEGSVFKGYLHVADWVVVTDEWSKNGTSPYLDASDGDTNRILTVDDGDTETDSYYTFEDVADPEDFNVDVNITNMEGCGNWVFAEEKYYNFVASYSHPINYTYFDTVRMNFSDGASRTIISTYDRVEDEMSISSGGDYIYLQRGTIITSSHWLNVTFQIYFNSKITDIYNASIYQWSNDTSGTTIGWELTAEDYFHIYNFGGQTLDSLTSSGNAGRLPGGDVFDFYAVSNTSEVEASIIFRQLQHIKLLPELTYVIGNEYSTFQITYSLDYCMENSSDFITGGELVITGISVAVGANERWINFTAYWYARNAAGSGLDAIKNEDVYFFTHAGISSGTNATTRLWIDIWFNRVNASTTFGMRLNAYEYPMKNTAQEWLRGWYGNWGVDDDKTKESMMFEDLRDDDGNVTSTTRIKLVRIRAKLEVYESQSGYTQRVLMRNFAVFDLSFGAKTEPFQGIQQPVFDESRVPTMQVGGFLGFIWSALLGIADAIGRAFGPALLGFWNSFVGFLDTIFAWLGFPNAFSQFISLLTNAWNWFIVSVIYVTTMIVQSFLFLAEVMGKFISLFTTLITQWISIAQWFWWMLDTGIGSAAGVWETLDIGTWVIIGAILYPIHIVFLWDEYGEQAAIAEVTFLINVFLMLVKGFLTLISFTINIIFGIIEMIPIAE